LEKKQPLCAIIAIVASPGRVDHQRIIILFFKKELLDGIILTGIKVKHHAYFGFGSLVNPNPYPLYDTCFHREVFFDPRRQPD